MHTNADFHDIIVIGASAGGVETLKSLARCLPADLKAAIFIVLHVGEVSYLGDILDRAGPLPAAHARSGEAIERGRIYVAPPDFHLLLHEDHVLLRKGPRENMARPAIDPLFRSAAATFGSRVIGVVLSGALSDGTAGLLAIKRCGGLAVVQDPADAIVPEMPRNALRHVPVDGCAKLSDMGALLVRMVAEHAPATPEIPEDVRMEAAIAAQDLEGTMDAEDRLGTRSRLTCPECHGTLWEIADGSMLRYRCHVGHSFNADAMLAAQSADGEQRLWALLRSYRERSELVGRMERREREKGNVGLARQLKERAQRYRQDAATINRLIHGESARVESVGVADQ